MCVKKRVVHWCLSLERTPFALFNFCFRMLMWSLKSKCSSNKTPRYLVQVFRLIFWPLKQKFSFLAICFLGEQKNMISVLLTFKAILFAWSHCTRFDRSKFIFLLRSVSVWANSFITFKGYLHYKTILCYKVAPDVQL